MEIQKYTPNQGLQPITTAMQSTMIRHMDSQDLKTGIAKVIAKAFQDSGQSVKDDDATYLVGVMPQELIENFPNIRINEIAIAIKQGVRKEYGDYFGLNVLSFSNFIKAYLASEERKKAALELNKLSLPEKSIPSPDELLKMENEIIVNAYSKFLENGHYDDLGNHIYKKLDERGLIPFNRERKLQIFEKARKNLESKYNPKGAISLDEKRTLQRHFDTLLSNSNDSKAMIATEAKKIALMTLFKELKETEIDINEFIIETEEKF